MPSKYPFRAYQRELEEREDRWFDHVDGSSDERRLDGEGGTMANDSAENQNWFQ